MSARTRVSLVLCFLALGAGAARAHDLFLKPEAFFVSPNSALKLTAFNGTFTTSEGSVTADRLLDLSIVGPAGRAKGDTTTWSSKGNASRWATAVGAAGTYVLGASIRPRTLVLNAHDFNKYLADDGLPDILAARKANGELKRDGRERYSKHVKALVQVGDAPSADFGTVLGYPAELVPLDNPYARQTGARAMRVRAEVDGRAIPNLVVIAGGRTPSGERLPQQTARTNAQGIASFSMTRRGVWYIKFIHMDRIPAAAKDSMDYESRWATLTFAVK